MRLTGDEYSRGVVSWDGDTPEGTAIQPYTASWDGPPPAGGPAALSWDGPYTDPGGSKVLSPAREHRQMKIGLHTSNPRLTPILRQVRWETHDGVQIEGSRKAPARVQFARREGYGARMVVEPTAAVWEGTHVLLDLENQTRVRLINGQVRGTEITPFETSKEAPASGEFAVEGNSQLVTLQGRFIEVHSTVDDDTLGFDAGVERARANCIATLGLLALVCGEQVLGDVRLEDYFETRSDGEYGRDRIPCYVSRPRTVGDQHVDAVDRALPWASHADRDTASFRHGVHLGLRWYVDAARARVPFECFTSSFLAIEALATSYVAEHGQERRVELQKFDELLAAAKARGISANAQMTGLVRGILGDLPLAQKFGVLRGSLNDKLGDGAADIQLFSEARQVRNRLLHGQQTELSWNEATPLRELVERVLATVIDVPLPEKIARVYEMGAEWTTRHDAVRAAGATGYLGLKMTLGGSLGSEGGRERT